MHIEKDRSRYSPSFQEVVQLNVHNVQIEMTGKSFDLELQERSGLAEAIDELAYRLPIAVGKTGPIGASVIEVTESTDGPDDIDREARPAVLRSLAHEVLFLITCATATALSSLSVGSANTALISIGNDLNMHDASSLSWIISAFSLTSGCVMLSSGRAAELYGRRRVFLIGSVIFTVACIISGFAVNKEMMYVMRAVQGLGTGICTPAGAGTIGATYLSDTRRKEKAFGLLGGASALAFLTGTVLGGVCSELLNWRWIYWTLAIISVLMTLGGMFVVPKECDERIPGRLDWLGLVLSMVGMSLLTYAVTGSTDAPLGWRTWYIPTLLVASTFVIALFIWSQHRQSDPMMPLSIWSFPNFALIMVIVFLAWGVFEVITVYLALYFQNIKNATPLLTSAYFIPDMLFGLISIPLPAFMLQWLPKRWVLFIGLVLLCIPTILYASVDKDTTYWAIPFPGISISAIGAFLLYNLANLFCSSSAPPEKQSLISGVFNTMLQTSSAVSLALAATVANLTGANGEHVHELARGYRSANWLCSGMMGLAIVLCLFVKEQGRGPKGPKVDSEQASSADSLEGSEVVELGECVSQCSSAGSHLHSS
ncbi:hypothetical protein YB2330_004227 [Saitoella coloradoensis]